MENYFVDEEVLDDIRMFNESKSKGSCDGCITLVLNGDGCTGCMTEVVAKDDFGHYMLRRHYVSEEGIMNMLYMEGDDIKEVSKLDKAERYEKYYHLYKSGYEDK